MMSDMSLNAWPDDLGLPGMGDHDTILNAHGEPDIPAPETPEEILPLDLSDEVDQLENTEAALEDTMALLADIVESGGMSQTYAQEAMRLIPDFCGSAPLGYFSKAPTATMYKVALEDITLQLGSLIAAAVGVLGYLVYKLLKWMFGGDTDKTPKEIAESVEKQVDAEQTGNDAVAEEIKKAGTIAQAVESDMAKGVQITREDGHQEKVSKPLEGFEAILKDSDHAAKAADFLKNPNPIFMDFIDNGEFSKRVEWIAGSFTSYSNQMDQKMKLLEGVLAQIEHNGDTSNDAAINKDLKDASGPIVVHYNGKDMTLKEIGVEIAQARPNAVSGENTLHRSSLSFSDLFTKMAKAMERGALRKIRQEYVMYSRMLADLDEKLDTLSKAIGTTETDDVPGTPPSDIAKKSRAIRDTLRDSILELGMILKHMEVYRNEVNRSSEFVMTFMHTCAMALERMMLMAGLKPDQFPESFKNFKKQARAVRASVAARNKAIREAKTE